MPLYDSWPFPFSAFLKCSFTLHPYHSSLLKSLLPFFPTSLIGGLSGYTPDLLHHGSPGLEPSSPTEAKQGRPSKTTHRTDRQEYLGHFLL